MASIYLLTSKPTTSCRTKLTEDLFNKTVSGSILFGTHPIQAKHTPTENEPTPADELTIGYANDIESVLQSDDQQKDALKKLPSFEEFRGALANTLSQLTEECNANNSEPITFKSRNITKLNFTDAVLGELAYIETINTTPNITNSARINTLIERFTESEKFLPDLKRAFDYLLRDNAKNQGDKKFHKFIKCALYVFEAIEKLTELGSVTDDDLEPNSRSRKAEQIRCIVHELDRKLDNINHSELGRLSSKLGFKSAAVGGAGGAAVAGGGIGVGVSFITTALASLGNIAAQLFAALGIAIGGAALTIGLPVTVCALGGGAVAVGGYKLVQRYKDGKAEGRLLNNYNLNSAHTHSKEERAQAYITSGSNIYRTGRLVSSHKGI